MFKHEFQGGSYVEVFSAQGRDPVAKWRLSGSASTKNKVYDKDVKSFVYFLEGETTTTKMSLPKDEKQSLGLTQRYLVLQLYVPLGHSFSLEFGVSDSSGNNKRRILLSSNHREITITQLHARFPFNILRLGVWLNLCFDLRSLVGETFKGECFNALENLTISASCRLRKIFTMKLQPFDTTDDDELYNCENTNSGELDNIPKSLQLSTLPDIPYYTQVINMSKILQAEIKTRERAGLPPPSTPILTEADMPGNKPEEQPTHIAFGSKVVIPKHARKSSREGGASSAGARSSSGLNHSGSIPHLTSVSPAFEPESGCESSRLTHRLSYQRSLSDATYFQPESSSNQLEVEATQTTMQPRPPRTGSGGKTRRRPLRIKHPGSSKVRNGDDKDNTINSVKNGVNGSSTSKDNVSDDQESISRSQSESSLKTSGDDNTLAGSFNKMSIKIPEMDQNGHDDGDPASSKEQAALMTKIEKGSPPVFTFSSRPRSAPRSPRGRQRKTSDFTQVTAPAEEKPEIKLSSQVSVDSKDWTNTSQNRLRKGSDRSEYDDDFYKASGESSAEEDDLQNFLKASGNSRCSSRGSKLSPLESPLPSPEPDPLSKSQTLRMSIRSSLLKEIPSPRKSNAKPYDAKNYQSDANSWRNVQSDASSWRFDTSVMSNNMLDKSLGRSFNSSFGHDSGIFREHLNSSGTGSEGIIINDGGDSLSDSSDDTTYSTWKGPPPSDKRIHRYLDEMRHPGPEPDLTATLPMDPREYSNAFSPPIVLPSQKRSTAGQQAALSAALSPPRSRNPSSSMDHHTADEEELDLLYDPCLNCYFDPRTHKYYELA
ncbi:uncharacterized protein C3orf67 homolog [Stylophora pistillata]|uniref:Uncharacterized protein C3orf67-like n=1 Tax=Stylophora pistillata TaxID=50429 RepID=A0A2B4SIV9_STYPI|nr:uncharacterized protein C3orf67 homolog [Stylophora pistillata]PFX30604.1 Uncharacterized protein C3orf67-like [Stylophora pistillata]